MKTCNLAYIAAFSLSLMSFTAHAEDISFTIDDDSAISNIGTDYEEIPHSHHLKVTYEDDDDAIARTGTEIPPTSQDQEIDLKLVLEDDDDLSIAEAS